MLQKNSVFSETIKVRQICLKKEHLEEEGCPKKDRGEDRATTPPASIRSDNARLPKTNTTVSQGGAGGNWTTRGPSRRGTLGCPERKTKLGGDQQPETAPKGIPEY